MGRPAIVDTEDLLRVAREIFLAQGFAVPTATIARAAGISEGSIYKRFATKEDLIASIVPGRSRVSGRKLFFMTLVI